MTSINVYFSKCTLYDINFSYQLSSHLLPSEGVITISILSRGILTFFMATFAIRAYQGYHNPN